MTQIHNDQSFSKDRSLQLQDCLQIKMYAALGISTSNTTHGTPKINLETQESQNNIQYNEELEEIQKLNCDKKYKILLLQGFKNKLLNDVQIMMMNHKPLEQSQINIEKSEEMITRGHLFFQQYIKKFRNQSEYFKKLMKAVKQANHIKNALYGDEEMNDIFSALSTPNRKRKLDENEIFLKDFFLEFRKENNKMFTHIKQAEELAQYYEKMKQVIFDYVDLQDQYNENY